MNQTTGSDAPHAQGEQPLASRQPGIRSGEHISQRDDSADAEENNESKNGGFGKWIAHLWSRDPDRQLELILAGAITVFAFVQLLVTVINNWSTSNQVEKIINAAQGINRAAASFSQSASSINVGVDDAVGRLQGQVDQVKRSADAANRAVAQQQQVFRAEQRPYIVPSSPVFSSGVPFSPDQKISANIEIRNIGNTPALNYVGNVDLFLWSTGESLDGPEVHFNALRANDAIGRKSFKSDPKNGEEDLAPRSGTFYTSPQNVKLSILNIEALRNGNAYLFMVGNWSYTDASGQVYTTELCYFFFGTDYKVWHNCEMHNRIK